MKIYFIFMELIYNKILINYLYLFKLNKINENIYILILHITIVNGANNFVL